MDRRIMIQIRVGAFVAIGLVLIMATIFLLGGEKSIFERHYTLNVQFDNISGLRLGAPVYLAGIGVGTVKDIRFPQNLEEKNVKVQLEIARKFQDRIRQDSEASIATQGLLGDKIILISVGTPATPALQDGDSLKTKKAFSFETLSDKGSELLEHGDNLLKNLDGLVTDIKEKKGMVHALIYDLEGEDIVKDLAAVSRSAKGVLREVQHGQGMLHALIYEKSDPQLAKKISKAVENMKDTSNNLSLVTSRIEKGEGSIGGLISDPTVYYDLKTLLGQANRSKLIKAVIRYTLNQNEKDTLK